MKIEFFQYKDLCCYNRDDDSVNTELANKHINEIKNEIDKFYIPTYHIIGTPCRLFRRYCN